jgi:pimeloyl-ACP methyl ester carboxylesterase
VTKPRLLLVPTVCELEWRIKPQLEEWAEVAAYDAPGVGEEPEAPFTVDSIVRRGIDEVERRGWDRCVVVADEFGGTVAARVASANPGRVRGLALGHPTLSLSTTGARAPINGEVFEAFFQLARTDFGSYVQALGQITQHAYDEEFVAAYRERVPQEVAMAFQGTHAAADEDEPLEGLIRSLEVPLLFVEHSGCLLFTREGFEDAAAAFPEAETAATAAKPSADPDFSELLREFCARLPA